jgi:DNA-binding HxlR family transcriptional regulator
MGTGPMENVRAERAACPLYTAIGVIEGRWKPMLVQRLGRGSSGFGELHRAMPGISRKVLTEQLRQMECDDLVVRRETGDRLGSVRYELTAYGETLMPVFTVLWRWGTGHLAREGAERGTLVVPPESAG